MSKFNHCIIEGCSDKCYDEYFCYRHHNDHTYKERKKLVKEHKERLHEIKRKEKEDNDPRLNTIKYLNSDAFDLMSDKHQIHYLKDILIEILSGKL